MEEINYTEMYYGAQFSKKIEAVRIKLEEIEKPYKLQDSNFSIDDMWGWNSRSGIIHLYVSEKCNDLNLKNKIEMVLKEVFN
jgi:hypothetical protein